MKKERVIKTQKLFIAVLFFGATTFGYAQDTMKESEAATPAIAQVQTLQQDPAIDALKKQIEANPNDTEAIVKLATAYQDAKDWDNALATWNQMSTLLPDWAPSYYSQAYVYQSMKDEDRAKTSYEKYIAAVKPEEVEASKKNLGYAHFFVAYKLQETDKEQAKQQIARSLEYDAGNEEAIKLNAFLNQ